MKACGYPLNSFRLCLDRLSDNMIEGRFYHLLSEKETVFRDISQFLLYADRILDQGNFPQSFQEKRSFHAVPPEGRKQISEILMDGERIKSMHGTAATADVIVMSRRHTSWQGVVRKTNGSKLGDFSGEIELIELLEKLGQLNEVL